MDTSHAKSAGSMESTIKAIAMAEQKPDPLRIAVAPHTNFGAIFEHDVKDSPGNRKVEMHGTICGFKMELYDMKRRLRHASALDDGGKQ